jgi:nucleoside-diphosphate-sugar epimerase
MKNKKILITGGGGFIPSHLTRRIVQMGAEVSVIVKYNSLMDNVRLVDIWDDIQIIEADIRNMDSISQIKKLKPDIVIHMAAYNHVGDSFMHVNEALQSNAIGTANVMEAYEDYELFIYTSTSEVYGYQTEVPFVETMLPSPISPYSIGKYSGELYARMKSEQQKRPVVVLRPFNAFGPYQSTRAIIGELIVNCLKGEVIETTAGEQTREFNFVYNLVDGFIKAIENKKDAIGKVINLGSGIEIKIKDLVSLIHELSQSESELRIGALEYRPTEIWRMYADSRLAKSILDWSPTIDFKEGLIKTIEWYCQYLDTVGRSGALVKLTN